MKSKWIYHLFIHLHIIRGNIDFYQNDSTWKTTYLAKNNLSQLTINLEVKGQKSSVFTLCNMHDLRTK